MQTKISILFAFGLCGLFTVAPAAAQTRLEAIRTRGIVKCAAFPRPGLANRKAGVWSGLYVDLCRAIAVATLGPDARSQFHDLELPRDAAALRRGDFDVEFLTAQEIVKASLADSLAPGPSVFFETHSLMVEKSSPVEKPEDLAGASICFNQARAAFLPLEEFFAKKGQNFIRMPFEEDVELVDAYHARHCQAIVEEGTQLAQWRLEKGVNNFDSRILAEPLSVFPILAASPLNDSKWSATVAWVIHFLRAAERPQSAWRPGGVNALALDAPELGLRAGWRNQVIAAVGDYGALYRRNLGDQSPYALPPGANALSRDGGLIAPPFSE